MTNLGVDTAVEDDVERMLGRLVEPSLARLAAQLRQVTTLSTPERDAVHAAVAATVTPTVWRRVSRVMLLELNAARVTGQLTAPDPQGRWREWVDRLASPDGWEKVAEPYPSLLPGIRTIVSNRCAAGLRLARRFGADRDRLAGLLGTAPGDLRQISMDAGDSHLGGQSVAIVTCDAGRLVYKPRSVRVDAVLGRFLATLLADQPADTRIRVPRVCTSDDTDGPYGWAEFIDHRYCRDDTELAQFYRGLGHWLAVMRVLSGSDLHNENVIACGPVPVVVDCETLFTPFDTGRASGYGDAVDLAAYRTKQSLLRSGLLPGRGAMLGWRGVDTSAAGFLPGEQPTVQVPTIADAGTDRARLALTTAPIEPSANLPSPAPDLGRYWQSVVDGFVEVTGALRALDTAGALAPRLAEFADCPVRVVVRDTTAYTELGRMLWHPSSLHEPAPARQRAAELLRRHADNRPGAPDDPAVIEAEITELLDGDVPVFTTTPATGVLTGPGGTRYGTARDLVAEALDRWRRVDPDTDRRVIQAAMVSAYLNDGWRSGGGRLPEVRARAADVDRRRRAAAAGIVRRMCDEALRGADGTATWVAAVRNPTGWSVQPLPADMYGGTAGVAVVLAGYLREMTHDRADPVPEVAELLAAVTETARRADDQQETFRVESRAADITLRPDAPGGYLGLGSRIWGWLLLRDLGAVTGKEALQRASALAALMPDAVAADQEHDLLTGAAGAIVPLLALAGCTDDAGEAQRWRDLAVSIGDRLRTSATFGGVGAGWPTEAFPDGIGGFAHGVTGIGWALVRLALATGADGPRDLADAAFDREESYFDADHRNWRDIRQPVEAQVFGGAWCHGSVGIGVAASDLLHRDGDGRWGDLLRRAATATTTYSFGYNHTLCHGDLGAWELLERAWAAGLGPADLRRDEVVARMLTSLEEHGPVSGMTRDAFSPAMMAGEGGVVYQLLRLHPDSDLPSVLLPDLAGPATD
jgi:type 2 lantibiotic biosynthesis protein LanM